MRRLAGWTPKALFASWDEHCARRAAASAPPAPAPVPAAYVPPGAAPGGAAPPLSAAAVAAIVDRRQASFSALLWLYLKRALTQHSRAKTSFLLDNLLVFVAALFLGLVNLGSHWQEPPIPLDAFGGCPAAIADKAHTAFFAGTDQVLTRGVMVCIAIGLTAVASVIRVFGTERTVYWREASGLRQPASTVAYFLGKDLSMIPQAVTGPLVFCLVFHTISNPRQSFGTLYTVLLSLYWASMGMGYLVSIVVEPSSSQLVGVVGVFANAQFAGGSPTIKALRNLFIPLCYVPYISYLRYALEAFYVGEAKEWRTVDSLMHLDIDKFVAETYGLNMGARMTDIGMVLAFGVAFRAAACVALLLKDRAKKI
jgi:hypothetical protein